MRLMPVVKRTDRMNFIAKLNMSGVTRFLLYVLIFFQPFNHFNSFREISFYGLLVFLVIRLIKDGTKVIHLNDRTVIAIFLLAGWSLLVSVSGPFPWESLNAVRKNLFKEVIIFLVIIMEFKSFRDIKPLFWVVVASFTAVTIASIIENIAKDWELFSTLTPAVSWRATSTYFFANYADNGTFYLPFIAAWLVSVKEMSWKKWIGAGTLMVGCVLIYIYNARTHLLTVFFVVFIIMLLAKKYKLVAVFVITAVLSISIVATSKYEGSSRYKTLLSTDTYTTDKGLTNRLGLWLVVVEIIKERPLIGYGYGWKKLASIIQEKDSDEFWGEYPPSARNYYVDDAQLMYGRVNPHNLPLQIIFEIGLIGFSIFLWLWGTVFWKIFKCARTGNDPQARKFIISSIGVIIAFVMVNITNSLWQECYGNMIFLFMAIVFVIHRETKADFL